MIMQAIVVVAFLAFVADPINFLLLGTFSYVPPNFRYRSHPKAVRHGGFPWRSDSQPTDCRASTTAMPLPGRHRPLRRSGKLDSYRRLLYEYTLAASDKLMAAVSFNRSIPSSKETIQEAIRTLSLQKRARQIEGELDEPPSDEDLEYGASPLDY